MTVPARVDLDDLMLLHKAIEFAAVKHKDQKRKGSQTPYIVHPVEVMLFLTECGCSFECVAAGVLHDTLEDTETTREELVAEFGVHIADLVAAESEDKSKSWQERKQATIDGLKTASEETKMICLADKLSNLQSMVYDYATVGEKLWTFFHADRERSAWYYRGIINGTKDVKCVLRDKLIENYIKMFGSADGLDI